MAHTFSELPCRRNTVRVQAEHRVLRAGQTYMWKHYLVLKSVEAFEDEVEQGVQVVWTRGSHKDVGVAVESEDVKSH